MVKEIKITLFNKVKNWVARKLSQVERNEPFFELKEKHIQNLQIVLNRETLLNYLPKNGIIAEIGVNQGTFSQKIIQNNQPKIFHLIDSWNTGRYHEGLMKEVKNKFFNQIESGVVRINKGLSTQVLAEMEDNYFDWVYIDTDHSYTTTINELVICARKIKPGGIIAGHDFIQGNWKNLVPYGVMKAVYEFCNTHNWELIYLTMESEISPSFALRKINENA